MKKCLTCGFENNDDDLFCKACSAPLIDDNNETLYINQSQVVEESDYNSNEKVSDTADNNENSCDADNLALVNTDDRTSTLKIEYFQGHKQKFSIKKKMLHLKEKFEQNDLNLLLLIFSLLIPVFGIVYFLCGIKEKPKQSNYSLILSIIGIILSILVALCVSYGMTKSYETYTTETTTKGIAICLQMIGIIG